MMPLNDLLKSLEDNGEVNYQLAEHKLTKDEAGNFSVAANDAVCFVLDSMKHRKKKAKVGSFSKCYAVLKSLLTKIGVDFVCCCTH